MPTALSPLPSPDAATMLRGISPIKPDALSSGWPGMQAVRFRSAPTCEITTPAQKLHGLVLVTDPPETLELRFDMVRRNRPHPPGTMIVVPADLPVYWNWAGAKGSFHIYLEPALVSRIAAESFGVEVEVPPIDNACLPELRTTMLALERELTLGMPGCPIMLESLSLILAIQLIRHVSKPLPLPRESGQLPPWKLEAVSAFIEENLESVITLQQMASVAHLSPYHFARQFKAATGLAPHQFVVSRRVQRAQQMIRDGAGLGLAEVAQRAGFSDQSQMTFHFRRLTGVTPGQFRSSHKNLPCERRRFESLRV
ncbi:MAG: AraC family transcriptional regulator [Verrucomicrobiota bacterium]